MRETRHACITLLVNSFMKRPLGRPRRRWEDNTEMSLRKVEYEDGSGWH
jgi:hypothetical protein